MPTVFKDLLSSKKFVFVCLTTVLLIAGGKIGFMSAEEVHAFLKVLWPVYLGAQGLADLGKHAAHARASTSSKNASPKTEPEPS